MSGLSSFLIITSILGVLIILYLILNMWIKIRKREIGILLSMEIEKVSADAVYELKEGVINRSTDVCRLTLYGSKER